MIPGVFGAAIVLLSLWFAHAVRQNTVGMRYTAFACNKPVDVPRTVRTGRSAEEPALKFVPTDTADAVRPPCRLGGYRGQFGWD
jgi:hypothetical protein